MKLMPMTFSPRNQDFYAAQRKGKEGVSTVTFGTMLSEALFWKSFPPLLFFLTF